MAWELLAHLPGVLHHKHYYLKGTSSFPGPGGIDSSDLLVKHDGLVSLTPPIPKLPFQTFHFTVSGSA